jgi:small subunit ribosomal protein S8
MLTRIRNGLLSKKSVVRIPYSKFKEEILKVLTNLGFLTSYSIEELTEVHKNLVVKLKYVNKEPAIIKIMRQSKPGCRFYSSSDLRLHNCPQHSVSIVSTSSGVISSRKAKELGVGGEVVCTVW